MRGRDYGVWRELNELDVKKGGKQAIFFSSPGAGKSTVLMNRIVTGLRRGEVCVWRAVDVDAFNTFHNLGRLRLLRPWYATYEWSEMSIDKKQKGRIVDPERDWGFDVETFGTVQEAVDLLEPGKVNVIVTLLPEGADGAPREQLWWTQFAHRLNHRLDGRWIVAAVDEVDDLIQESPQGLEYWAQKAFKRELRQFRKRLVDLWASVHNYRDIYFNALTKFRFRGWLRGAHRIPGHTRLFQPVLDALPIGKGIIEAEYFEDFSYPEIPEAYRAEHLISLECVAVQEPKRVRAGVPVSAEVAEIVRRVQRVEAAVGNLPADEDVEP